jgi:hypothetical protein
LPSSSADRELADRAAVERAWLAYSVVERDILSPKYTPQEWPVVLKPVAIDPTYSRALSAATRARNAGIVVWGQAIHSPYWKQPIGGKNTAVMGDCIDAHNSGSLWVKTGKKRTVGKVGNNSRVTLVRGSDGKWRVKLIEDLVDQPC